MSMATTPSCATATPPTCASTSGGVTPAGAPAVTRWQLATELVADISQLEQRIATVEARIKGAVAQSNTSLIQLFAASSGPLAGDGR
jgi:hypothetical protein